MSRVVKNTNHSSMWCRYLHSAMIGQYTCGVAAAPGMPTGVDSRTFIEPWHVEGFCKNNNCEYNEYGCPNCDAPQPSFKPVCRACGYKY